MTPEELTIQAFMASPQKQRMLELLGVPKKRKKLVDLLDHLKGLDERFASRISRGSQNVETITATLETPARQLRASSCRQTRTSTAANFRSEKRWRPRSTASTGPSSSASPVNWRTSTERKSTSGTY